MAYFLSMLIELFSRSAHT